MAPLSGEGVDALRLRRCVARSDAARAESTQWGTGLRHMDVFRQAAPMPTRSMPHSDRRPTITPDEFADYVHALADELRAGAKTMGMLDLAEALEAVCEEAARERALYRSSGNAAPDDAA